MAEVAGLVLGGIPIAIWALEKYAEPFNAFHYYRNSIETLRTNLILQNRQLQTTLSNIGLGNKPSINELRECFEAQFPQISRELMFIVQHMDQVTAGLLKNLDIDVDGKVEQTLEVVLGVIGDEANFLCTSQIRCQIRRNGNGVE
jgi:hypothetical protein